MGSSEKTLTSDLQAADTGPSKLKILRSYVDERWAFAKQRHQAGGTGAEVVAALASSVDTLIASLYEEATREHGKPRSGGYAIGALGGYGRGQFSPGSDIDLLFLFGKVQEGDAVTRSVLHTLWDLRFEVGYSTRTITDCVSAGEEDVESLTALLESRFLVGDRRLFSNLQSTITSRFGGRRARNFVQQKIRERRRRHERASFSVQLQEPNLKENPGGLRDFHTVGWLLRARHKKAAPEGLLEERLLNRRAYSEYTEAVDFLLKTRNELHFQTGKKHDTLDYDLQPAVAEQLAYEDADGELAVERFLRDYYRYARSINHLTDLVCERLADRPSVNVAVDLIVRRELDDGAMLSHTVIQLPKRRKSFFEDDPHRLLSLFLDAQRFGARISEAAQQSIKDHLHLIDDELRTSPKAARIFLNILRGGAGITTTLRQMHELGVLGAYIPEFGGLTCLVQYNLYHIYTADEHTLVAVRNLERLGGQADVPRDLRPLRRIYRELPRHDLLYLALVMHDAGKAVRGDDHSVVGAKMACRVLTRLGLEEPHIRSVEFLVRDHLTMSHISQRRDLDDANMIADFADRFERPDDLRMLYLLTYADLSAVTTTAWTAWKGQLLWELYLKAFDHLTGRDRLNDVVEHDEAISQLVGRLAAPEDISRTHLEGLPPRYAESSSEEEVARHLALVDRLGQDAAAVEFTRDGPFTETTICTKDHPYRLSQICGVLATNDLNVFSAQAYTRSDGIVLDTFQVTGPDGQADIEPSRQRRFVRQLKDVLNGKTKVIELFDRHQRRWSRRRTPKVQVAPEVRVENDISEHYTVIDVFAPDEAGLLYRITQTLSDLDLDIYTARIGTQADRAIDAFYVRHKARGKLQAGPELEILGTQLLQKLTDT